MPKYIAEIGINANGSVEIAKKLIDMAAECGCHAVKFQKRTIDKVYTPGFLGSPRPSPWGTTQREQKEGLEFGLAEYDEIDQYCKKKEIVWFASAWDVDALDFLEQFNPVYHKIASAMLTNINFVQAVAKTGRHTFISTGGSSDEDVARVIPVFRQHDSPFTLFHCVSLYPCEDKDAHLARMLHMKKAFMQGSFGYSGHEVGFIPSVVAAAMGASYIERHITLDRSMYGSDQSASLERRGLELMIKYCDAAVESLGFKQKPIDLIEREAQVMKGLRYWEE